MDTWHNIDYRMTHFNLKLSKLSEDLSYVGILSSQCDEKGWMILLSIRMVADVDCTKVENGNVKKLHFLKECINLLILVLP